MFFRSLTTVLFIAYHFYTATKRFIYSKIGSIKLVYELKEGKLKFLSLLCYMRCIDIEAERKLYVKVHDANGFNHMGFIGKISDVNKLSVQVNQQPIKRKKFALCLGDQPIDLDLQILDDYAKQIKQFGDRAIASMTDIVRILGIKADTIAFYKPVTFIKYYSAIDQVQISDLYD